MYLFDPNRPTELFHERQEALIGEARDARLARQLRAARRQERTTSERGPAYRGRTDPRESTFYQLL